MDDLLTDFLAETAESLAALDIALLKLERTPGDQETLSLTFRLVHTIKGTCGFLALSRLERVAHAAENVLGRLRDGELAATAPVVSLILAALDAIKHIVAGLGHTSAEPAGDDDGLIAALEAVARDATADGQAGAWRVAASEAEPETQTTAGGPTIRVAVDVLDHLMTLISELVLTRNQLLQLARSHPNDRMTVPLQRLSHLTSELQAGVMKTRMQPVANAWATLPRLVRDLARDLGKKIELVMRGGETELDRQVLELIKDPLTHMVRNSGDHGLEDPAGRRATGKPETGRITLNACHDGGHIIIEVSDDGRGLPADRIRARALASGIAGEPELAAMEDAQLQSLIFRPGFSTAEAITSVSGRGVGMDVVKTNIERIGGTIVLQSTAGAGTRFIIKIPLTLAIIAALIVEAGGERFAIPQIGVVELVRLDGRNPVERIGDTPVLRLRNRLLPLVHVASLLNLSAVELPAACDNRTIVVAQVGGTIFGLIVDRVFDTEEIVVKPVAPILRHIAVFSGNTILGDGTVTMILDPSGIARHLRFGAGRTTEAPSAVVSGAAALAAGATRTTLLVVEAGAKRLAVPLTQLARLEQVLRERIQHCCGAPVTQHRGRLMRLVALDSRSPDPADWPDNSAVLVFTNGTRALGLVVSQIIDVVDDELDISLGNARPGLLGTALIGGRATDVLDPAHYLTAAFPDWFTAGSAGEASRRVLLVEDSGFLRTLALPPLAAAGYKVAIAGSAEAALRLRDAGTPFDAIISDIEMPGLGGLGLARAVREGGAWQALPMIALISDTEPAAIDDARVAGFTDYVVKFDRASLLAALTRCLARPLPCAA